MKRALIAGLIVLLAGPFAAAATIDLGNHIVEAEAGQLVTVTIFPTVTDETIIATSFYCSLDNGPDDSLKFTALDFEVNDADYGAYQFSDGSPTWDMPYFFTAWSGSATEADGGAGAEPCDSRTAYDPVAHAPFPILGSDQSPAGLVLVTLDASAAPPGTTWEFHAFSSLGPTSINQEITIPANPVYGFPDDRHFGIAGPLTMLSGTITIAGDVAFIPEPAVLMQLLALAGMGGLGVLYSRRKNRARQ